MAGQRLQRAPPEPRALPVRVDQEAAKAMAPRGQGGDATVEFGVDAEDPDRPCAVVDDMQMGRVAGRFGPVRKGADPALLPGPEPDGQERGPVLGPRPPQQRPYAIASSSSMKPSIIDRPLAQKAGSEASRPKGFRSSLWCFDPPARRSAKYFSWKSASPSS